MTEDENDKNDKNDDNNDDDSTGSSAIESYKCMFTAFFWSPLSMSICILKRKSQQRPSFIYLQQWHQ